MKSIKLKCCGSKRLIKPVVTTTTPAPTTTTAPNLLARMVFDFGTSSGGSFTGASTGMQVDGVQVLTPGQVVGSAPLSNVDNVPFPVAGETL